MGFSKPDLHLAQSAIHSCMHEIRSPYNDGWVSCACKHELFQLKSWLEDEYAKLPKFDDEQDWEQQRIIDLLRQK